MRAAYLTAPKILAFRDEKIPEPGPGFLRIRLVEVGICGSDVHYFGGHRPLPEPTIIGHEGWGYIDALGSGVDRMLGERVVVDPNTPCGKCIYCQRGQATVCPNKRTIGLNAPGCFAEYVVVPADFAHTLPDAISNADAVTIEPTAVAFNALKHANLNAGDAIYVLGLGAIGMLITHLGIQRGLQVYVGELNTVLLEKAISLGAQSEDWQAADVRVLFECTGSAAATTSLCADAPRGSSIVLLGLSEKSANFTPLDLVRRGISIRGSLIYDHPDDFESVIQSILAGEINPGQIISKHIPLSDLEAGLIAASSGYPGKIVVQIK
ncbi:MAG: alcohol dehydrogenase catalytic domain-containing protein [Bacteroidota bacterium]